MDFLDYREKLKIGFSDTQKASYCINMFENTVELIKHNPSSEGMSLEEYRTFCDTAGVPVIPFYMYPEERSNRLVHALGIVSEHTQSITEFLSYYMVLTNSISTKKEANWNRSKFVELIKKMLSVSHIPYDIMQDGDEYLIFPKGVPEMDYALVSELLDWLSKYPNAQKAYIKALREYADQNDKNASDIADKFRKALETFFHEFFCVDKSLESLKKEYGIYLKEHGIPAEISCNFETLLQAYTNYINGYAKHQDRTSRNVLEYLMYQTGNIIRLLITLKQEEEENAH